VNKFHRDGDDERRDHANQKPGEDLRRERLERSDVAPLLPRALEFDRFLAEKVSCAHERLAGAPVPMGPGAPLLTVLPNERYAS